MTGLVALLLAVTTTTATVAQPEPNPWKWTEDQVNLATTIIDHAESNGIDPYTLVALAWVESNIRPHARSPSGDYGLFQVNCKLWWQLLDFDSWAHCREEMLKPIPNIQAAIEIYTRFSGWSTCKGSQIFQCYNGGPKWVDSKNREKIEKYAVRVRNVIWRLKKAYSHWVEQQRIPLEASATLDEKS